MRYFGVVTGRLRSFAGCIIIKNGLSPFPERGDTSMGEKGSVSKNAKTSEESGKKKKGLMSVPRIVRYAVGTTILLLGLIGLSAAFILRVYFNTESSCYDVLAIETDDAITELEDNLRSDRTMLRVIAGLIGNASDIDSIEVSGYLANYDINSLITQIGILLPDDGIVISNGHRANVDETMKFDSLYLKGEHISGNQSTGSNSNAIMIRNFVPIRKDGICIGLLFSAANSSSIAKAWLPGVYEKNGYCYVVDRKTGKVIINSASDDVKEINDIYFRQTDSMYTKEETIKNILDGKKGYSVYGSEKAGEEYYMCYLPFGIEDWEMVVVVPESAVFAAVTPVRNGLYGFVVAAAVLIAIYAFWLRGEIRSSIAEAEQKANTDVLTGLENRNRYEAYLKKLEGTKEKLICIFIDANGLHDLNNSKGHSAGDQMLRFIADTLKVQFGEEHIYRIGGDEFVVFRSDRTQEDIDKSLAEFNETLVRNDYHAAVGICSYEPGMTIDTLIANAEKEMYKDKHKYYEQTGKAMRI